MKNQALLLLFASLVPLFTALVGTIIEIISLQDSVTVREKQVKRMLMCYFAVFILIGSGVSTGMALPVVSVWLWPATVFSLYMAPVFYYRFVVLLTQTGRKDSTRYSGHYLLPFVVAAGCVALSFIVPFDIRLQLVKGETVTVFPVTAFIFFTIPVVQFIFTIVYMTLAYRKLLACYRQHGDKSPRWGEWFRISQGLCVLSLLWSGAFFLMIWRGTAPWALPLAVVSAWIQAIFLCCDSFNRQSLLFLPLTIAPVPLKIPFGERPSGRKNTGGNFHTYQRWTPTGDPVEVEPVPLNRKIFERQVVGKKLFLNPQLRLSDLMELFRTNRTYLSGFINREYEYGFNGYINRLRLAELERLMRLPSNRGKSANKLYSKAGFSSYRMYLRINGEVKNQGSTPISTNPENTTP